MRITECTASVGRLELGVGATPLPSRPCGTLDLPGVLQTQEMITDLVGRNTALTMSKDVTVGVEIATQIWRICHPLHRGPHQGDLFQTESTLSSPNTIMIESLKAMFIQTLG